LCPVSGLVFFKPGAAPASVCGNLKAEAQLYLKSGGSVLCQCPARQFSLLALIPPRKTDHAHKPDDRSLSANVSLRSARLWHYWMLLTNHMAPMKRKSALRAANARLWAAAVLLVCATTLGTLLALANEHRDGPEHDATPDHDRARQALVRGEIAPLEKVLAAIRSKVQGDFIGAELEIEDGVWVYDLKFIDRRGVLRKIHVDAKSGKILGRDDYE
jgi:uncharacterized membrane protein YkoI